jgi:hypothetical protein
MAPIPVMVNYVFKDLIDDEKCLKTKPPVLPESAGRHKSQGMAQSKF